MRKHIRGWRTVLILAGTAALLCGALDQSTRDALKVGHLLKTIAQKTPAAEGQTRSATISQVELNAYIAWRLNREPDSGVQNLVLDLADNNHVAGKLRFDAARLNLDRLIGEALDFDFKGILITRNRAARLDLIALSLNGYPVKPQVLDYVLESAAMHQGAEAGGLKDWYALPDGIETIQIVKGAAVLYY